MKKQIFFSLMGVILLATAGIACADDAVTGLRSEHLMFTQEGSATARFAGELFARTELFFGSAKPDGSAVTEEEFQMFLDEEITPRFPDGLTLLTGLGQFRGASGLIVQEQTFLLILLYPVQTRRDSSELIEQIRQAYLQDFQQESVLRADRCCERVGF